VIVVHALLIFVTLAAGIVAGWGLVELVRGIANRIEARRKARRDAWKHSKIDELPSKEIRFRGKW